MEEFQCKYYISLLRGVFKDGLHVCDVVKLKEDNEDNSLTCGEGYGQVKVIGDYNGPLGACIPFCNSIYQDKQAELKEKSKAKKQKTKLTKDNKNLITRVISANGKENLHQILVNDYGFSEKNAQKLQTKYMNFREKQSA